MAVNLAMTEQEGPKNAAESGLAKGESISPEESAQLLEKTSDEEKGIDSEDGEGVDTKDLDISIEQPQTKHAKDSGWSWVVALASHMICIMVGGMVYTGGVLLDDFQAEFEEPRSTVSLAPACQYALYQMSGPLTSMLTNRFGTGAVIVIGTLTSSLALMVGAWSPNSPVLILSYGVVCGFGLSMIYLAGIVAVSTHFQEKRTLATGLATCGSGVGLILFAPLTDYLLYQYWWRWTLMILGAIVLHGMLAASLMRLAIKSSTLVPSSSQRVRTNEGNEDERERSKYGQLKLLWKALNVAIFKRGDYWLAVLGNFTAGMGLFVPLLYAAESAKQVGISDTKAVFLLSIIGIANTACRILSALLVQIFRLNSVLVTALALLLCGLVTGVYPHCESYPLLVVLAVLFGLGMATFITLASVMLCDILGPANVASAYGYVFMVRGVASLIGPPVASVLIDQTGLFGPAFYLGGGMLIMGGLFHLLLYLFYFTSCQKLCPTVKQ